MKIILLLTTILIAQASDPAANKGTCSPYLRAKDKDSCESMSRTKAEENLPAKLCVWNPKAEDKCECCIFNSEEPN